MPKNANKLQRNANDFTRGSQLFVHEIQMFTEGLKVPFYIMAVIWAFATVVALMIWYSHEEFYLAFMRVYSALWGYFMLDPDKPVQLQMLDGRIGHTTMQFVSYVPEVRLAWNRFLNVIFSTFMFSVLVGYPASIWFIQHSKKRGNEILQEHHERGALLVAHTVLDAHVRSYNSRQAFVEWEREDPANRTASRWDKMTNGERYKMGVHFPYLLAGIPYPYKTEMAHTMFIGSTGSGKTVQMLTMIAQSKQRGNKAVVFDLTGQYVERFYNPETDVILNPFDERCPSWTIFNDCPGYVEMTAAASALVPSDGGTGEPFWVQAARTLFVEMCEKLRSEGRTTNRDIAKRLMTADLKTIHASLRNTIASPITSTEAARMAESIRSTFVTNAQALRFLPDAGRRFSITEWLAADVPGSTLFISSSYSDLQLTRQLLTLWLDIAVQRLLIMPRTRQLRSWFFFDEIHALHRLPAIENGLQTARGYGGAFVLGLHSFDKLAETYGEKSANTLAALARTKLILTTADTTTAETCSAFIGSREVRQMDEGYSYGISKMRDGSTVTPTTKVEPLVLPDDLMNLPSLSGYVKFAEGFPAARIAYPFRDWPVRSPGFIRRQNIRPIETMYELETTKGTTGNFGADALDPNAEGGLTSKPDQVIGIPNDALDFLGDDHEMPLYADYERSLKDNPSEQMRGVAEERRTDPEFDLEQKAAPAPIHSVDDEPVRELTNSERAQHFENQISAAAEEASRDDGAEM
jgi:type IV conjugative transfer system coupling protein TraD